MKHFILFFAFCCFCAYGVTLRDSQGTTNYYGTARSSRGYATPNISNNVWTVYRVVVDSSNELVSVMQGYSGTGASAQEAIAWTNRYDAVYK